jgi:hypothetical protein
MKTQDQQQSPGSSLAPATKSRFDYGDALQTVLLRGKELYGERFHIPPADRPAILKLLCWFLEDEVMAAAKGIDLTKGILLTGPPGCGKTAIMNVLQSMCYLPWRFLIKTSRQAAQEFARQGYEVIDKYTIKHLGPNGRPITICFDDLGCESNISYYGTRINTMAEILPARYDLFMKHKVHTHVTTNLNSAGLEARYGVHIRNRMSEMFNLITFPKDSQDKRRR